MNQVKPFKEIDYSILPSSLRDGTRLWIENGIPPGGFLQAVIANNLVEAVGRADHKNIDLLREIVLFFYSQAPSDCWGSVQNLHDWSKNEGALEF